MRQYGEGMIMEEKEGIKRPHKTRERLIIALCVITFLIFCYFLVKSTTVVHDGGPGYNRILCGNHLSSLGKELMVYANDHNDLYPDLNKWCDILMKVEGFSEKVLKCPDDKVGPSSYAMNPNCTNPLMPSDLVLLFETKPGWNQHGGPEILNPENHPWRGTKGCNILFNDGHVQFIESKDFNSLRWK